MDKQTDNEIKREKVRVIPIKYIDGFPNHPFQVKKDKEMEKLMESIKTYGVLTPIIVRKKENERYEIISGHRRKRACELLGIELIQVILKDMTQEEAIIAMVDSNLQREKILPSEKARAYKMKSEAMKRQGMRTDLTLSPMATKLPDTASRIGQTFGESRDQVFRYICLCQGLFPRRTRVDFFRTLFTYLPFCKKIIRYAWYRIGLVFFRENFLKKVFPNPFKNF